MLTIIINNLLKPSFFILIICLLLLSSNSANASVIQRIGNGSGDLVDALPGQLKIVGYSTRFDPANTPFILTAKIKPKNSHKKIWSYFFKKFRPKTTPSPKTSYLDTLSSTQKQAVIKAYNAGQSIVMLEANVHDIADLHELLDAGIAHDSSTDPDVLAYVLRKVNNQPFSKVITYIQSTLMDDEDPYADEIAFDKAIDLIASELQKQPQLTATDSESFFDWESSPVKTFEMSSTKLGTYNTQIAIYALHSCENNKDYYLVDTGGDWTPTDARFQSASASKGQIRVSQTQVSDTLSIDWQDTDDYCTGGISIEDNQEEKICRYIHYPRYYHIQMTPPGGPDVVQVNAAPAGEQGVSSTYFSGFSFSIGGGVNVSGKGGASAGVQAGATWSKMVSTTVPPLLIKAGNVGNQGAFTEYLYCTEGTDSNSCDSKLKMSTKVSGLCKNFKIGDPQNGQTPDGRLSNVEQSVNWEVDPETYAEGSSTFDITVTWKVETATSTTRLWNGHFANLPENDGEGPKGYCNFFGCSCSIKTVDSPIQLSQTFKIPYPSKDCTQNDE